MTMPGVEGLTGQLSFGVLDVQQTLEVIETYREHPSVAMASDFLPFPYAPASVARLINWAEGVGLLTPEERMPQGGRPDTLIEAQEALERHPLSNAEDIARLVGCGVSTVYRAKRMLGNGSDTNDLG